MSLAAIGIASGLVQGGLIRPTIRWIGERGTLLAGLLFGATGFTVYGLAPTGAIFWLGIPVMALWGLAGAAWQAMMSRLVGASEQGQLQGANSSIMALAGLFGPGLFTQTFACSITPGARWHEPGTPFVLAAALLVAAVCIAWQVTRRVRVAAAE
jgi:DHA1 family tetracycline resistance protein-like MFS transporter